MSEEDGTDAGMNDWLERRRSVVVHFIEASVPAPPTRWAGWSKGPLEVDGYNGSDGLPPAVWSAIVGSDSQPRRWHRSIAADAPLDPSASSLIALEAVKVVSAEESRYLFALHVQGTAPTRHDSTGDEIVDGYLSGIATFVHQSLQIAVDWGEGRSLARSAVIARLVCVPDDPSFLPPASITFSDVVLPPGHAEMFSLVNDEPLVSPVLMQQKSDEVIQIQGGEVMIGLKTSVAAADFGEESYTRTCVISALCLVLAERVALRRLAQDSESLTAPGRNPRAASDLSRSINAYRSLYSWAHASPMSPIIEIVNRYREAAAIDLMEAQLQGFASAALAEVAVETNILLMLVAVLGVAVAVATAAIAVADWKGWNVAWALLVAIAVFSLMLLPPFSRPLRQEIFAQRAARRPTSLFISPSSRAPVDKE